MIMKRMKHNETAHTDLSLRNIIKNELPQAPQDPLFTRKVMNRLPDSKIRNISIIETTGYIAAFLLIIIMLALTACDITASHTVTVGNIVTLAALSGTFIAVTTAMAKSLVSK